MHGADLSRRSAFRFAERSGEPHLFGERAELRIRGCINDERPKLLPSFERRHLGIVVGVLTR